MPYRIEFLPAAAKDLESLDRSVLKRVAKKIDALAADAHPAGSVKLSGIEGLYRVRIGDYRVVYQVQGKALMVLIVRVAHRREVYRGL